MSAYERIDALGGILDDIEHIAQVDHFGPAPGSFRPVNRIPSIGLVPKSKQPFDVGAQAAAVVEESSVGSQESVFEQSSDGFRQFVTDESSFVAVNCRFAGWRSVPWWPAITPFEFMPLIVEAALFQ